MRFILNENLVDTDAPPGMPVVDWVRDDAGLKGTKHACREGDCGSCLVLVGSASEGRVVYRALTSCLLPLGEVEGRHLVTIEGLNAPALIPTQRVIVDHGASQCGFCTPGIVVALTGYLLNADRFNLPGALVSAGGNLCRCTGYASIRRAIADLIGSVDAGADRIAALIEQGVVPRWFADIAHKLEAISSVTQTGVSDPSLPVVAGGSDLYVQQPEALAASSPRLLRRSLPSRIWADNGSIYLSATTTAEDLKRSQVIGGVIGGIDRFMDLVCSEPVREQATVGGNIVNASPIGDMTLMLLALDAELGIRGAHSGRTVPLRSFYKGYKQLDLNRGEVIEWIRFDARHRSSRFNFEKVCKRRHLDIASVNSAACLHVADNRIAEAHLSAGGVAPAPLRLARTSDYLTGRPVSAATAREAAAMALTEIAPISDVRGSAEYKRLLLRQLILAHFNALFGVEDGLVEELFA
jgi:xanthine dehydrogenase small subunit